MRVTVVRPGDLGPSEADLWARFQASSPMTLNPFLSLTFAQVVDRARPNARVAVVDADGGIEAFLAFELAPRRIGMPIGYPMNDLQGLVSRGTPIDVRRVVRQAGLRGWRFVAAPAEHRALAQHHYEGTAAQAPVMDLSDGFKAYFASRSKSLTDRCAKQRRSVERRVGPLSLEWGSTAPEHVRRLIDWKSARYGGARDLFSQPAARRILEELAATSSTDCRGLMCALRAGERTVAVDFGLISPGGLSGWFGAYDRELSRFSPGTMILLAIAEEAARQDITWVDMGYGQDSYKFRLANASYPVAGGAVWANRWEQAARSIYRRLRAAGEAGAEPSA
jgi:CelD/BcsL family acetyltransferase involved in cellulose biosynthesis